MPKKSDLTSKEVEKLAKKQGTHRVSKNLYMQVTGDSITWLYRYMLHGKAYAEGLGSKYVISLSKAREISCEKEKLVKSGINPLLEKRKERAQGTKKTLTFKCVSEEYMAKKEVIWKNAVHKKQWKSTFETYVYCFIGKKDISEVNSTDIYNILDPIWQQKPETARRIKGRIDNVMSFAIAREYRSNPNPVNWKDNLKYSLGIQAKAKGHFPSLHWKKVSDFMKILQKYEGMGARALEFAILTGLRTEAVRSAQWCEVDFENRVWKVPHERMKKKTEDFDVPLSSTAIKLLVSIKNTFGEKTRFIFPGKDMSKQISNATMLQTLKRINYPENITPHGFRATVRTWGSEETTYSIEVLENVLAHKPKNKLDEAYQRGDLYRKRAKFMQDWSDYLEKDIEN